MNTIKEIREEIEYYYSLNKFIRLFCFSRRRKIIAMMKERLSFGGLLYSGMDPCNNEVDHYKELSERYRNKWLEVEKKLEHTEKVLQAVKNTKSGTFLDWGQEKGIV